MSSTQRSFADEARELEASLPRDRQVAVVRLRALHEAWARAILGLGPKEKLVPGVRVRVESGIAPDKAAEASAQLARAEKWQWEIGTWSSGAGEGLSSMFEVRTLQLARAWLSLGDPAAARALALEVQNDPNRIAARLEKHVHALHARLDG